MVLSTVLLALVLVAVLVGYLSATKVGRDIWSLAGFAFLARAGFAVVNQSLGLLSPADESGYHVTLQFVAQQWHSGVIDAPLTIAAGPGHTGLFAQTYSVVLGPVYAIFGSDMVHVRLVMALFGTLVVINLYRIGREIHSRRGGLYAAGIATIFPYWIYLSGILYRDMLVVLLFTWVAYYLIRWQRYSDRRALTLCFVAATLAATLRLENLPAIAAMVSIATYAKFEPSIKQKVATAIALTGSLGIFLYQFGDEITIQQLASRRRHLARDSPASYLTNFAYESIPELVAFAPIGTLYFLLVPFPWQTVNFLSTISIFQNLFVWYPVVALAILGARDTLASAEVRWLALPLVAFALVGILTYGLVEGNIGPAMRHRSQFQFVFFAFAGVALARRVQFVVGDWTGTYGPGQGSTISDMPRVGSRSKR